MRHLLFTSADQEVVGETLYVTSEVIDEGPGRIWFWRGPGLPAFDVRMGDTARVFVSDPTIVPASPVWQDSLDAGGRFTELLAFTGALWDTLGRPFAAPEGRYVVRRTFTYSRSRDMSAPIGLARGVEFRWVVP